MFVDINIDWNGKDELESINLSDYIDGENVIKFSIESGKLPFGYAEHNACIRSWQFIVVNQPFFGKAKNIPVGKGSDVIFRAENMNESI